MSESAVISPRIVVLKAIYQIEGREWPKGSKLIHGLQHCIIRGGDKRYREVKYRRRVW